MIDDNTLLRFDPLPTIQAWQLVEVASISLDDNNINKGIVAVAGSIDDSLLIHFVGNGGKRYCRNGDGQYVPAFGYE